MRLSRSGPVWPPWGLALVDRSADSAHPPPPISSPRARRLLCRSMVFMMTRITSSTLLASLAVAAAANASASPDRIYKADGSIVDNVDVVSETIDLVTYKPEKGRGDAEVDSELGLRVEFTQEILQSLLMPSLQHFQTSRRPHGSWISGRLAGCNGAGSCGLGAPGKSCRSSAACCACPVPQDRVSSGRDAGAAAPIEDSHGNQAA